jgi:hypothetical protein
LQGKAIIWEYYHLQEIARALSHPEKINLKADLMQDINQLPHPIIHHQETVAKEVEILNS